MAVDSPAVPAGAFSDMNRLLQAEEARQVARARTGDEAAFAWLLEKYRVRVVRLAALTLQRPSEGEDAAQEAFIRAFRSLGKLRDDSRFKSWLFQITIRTCLNRMKASRWQMEMLDDQALAQQPSAASSAEALDQKMMVQSLLDLLSPPLRAALVLRELEGLDYDDIARSLEVPVGTVRSRLNAARDKFRQLWLAASREADDV